jgi:hypothetical protein
MTRMRWRDPDAAPAGRVTAVETFFDVVFVFTLTQLTRTLENDLSLACIGRILLVFGALWYMYGGYAWLTNHVPPRRGSQKLVLFASMAGFFIAAIAHAFDGTGVLFGVGYLVVICVHLILFTQADVLEGVLRLAPYNVSGHYGRRHSRRDRVSWRSHGVASRDRACGRSRPIPDWNRALPAMHVDRLVVDTTRGRCRGSRVDTHRRDGERPAPPRIGRRNRRGRAVGQRSKDTRRSGGGACEDRRLSV